MLWKISPENTAQNQIRVRFPADTLHLACKGIKMRLKTGANTFAREEKINMQSNTYKWEQRQWWRVGRSQNQDKLGWVKRMGVQKNESAHGNTIVRLLSCCAHGSTVALITDVAENLGWQETKPPAVPPHYDIITEGCPVAFADPITRAGPWHVPHEVPQWSHTYKHFPPCKNPNSYSSL